MTTFTRIAAVTGGNKGIGLACVRQLALQYRASSFNNGPLLIYLTARNQERGEAALKDIHDDPQLKRAKALCSDGGLADVQYLPLDINSKPSIDAFAAKLAERHPDGIDVLINNAGMAMEGFDLNVVKQTLHCNYSGTLEATRKLLPRIRDGGRLVNVASLAGHLTPEYSKAIRSRFLSAEQPSDITALMEEFTSAVAANSYNSDWPGKAYGVSKAGVIGLTRIIAAENARTGSKTLVNACCPGWVRTDMTSGNGHKTVDEGAMTPVLLALGDIGDANGQFWQHERAIEW